MNLTKNDLEHLSKMPDIKLSTGKYAGKFISDLCKDRRYMNWVMTTWDHGTHVPKAIKAHIELQKEIAKRKYSSTTDTEFVKEWLAASYEGYKILTDDLEWVQVLIGTEHEDITIGFTRNEYVFKVDKEEFAIKPVVVNERKNVFGAFRNDIQEQINDFRRKAFHNKREHRCTETGIALKNDFNTHTDHHFRKKTFLHIVGAFIYANTMDFNTVEIENCGMFYRLKDREIADRWNDFHKEHAILRLIHVSANTNAEYYLKKYTEPPFEPTPKKVPAEKLPEPKFLTFDMFRVGSGGAAYICNS